MQNFGRIKYTLNGLLTEGIGSKENTEGKNLFKSYLKLIKESKILKTQFLVYNNIENKVDSDFTSATDFIKENLSLMNKFSISDIKKENEKLIALSSKLTENLDETYEKSSLHESLGFLMTTKKTPANIDLFSQHLKTVAEHVNQNKVKEVFEQIDLPRSMVSSILVDKYNEKYSTLDEGTKKILKSLIDSDDEAKNNIYKEIVRECIDLIDTNLKTADLNTKESLLKVKDRILSKGTIQMENFAAEIGKIENLRISLINN